MLLLLATSCLALAGPGNPASESTGSAIADILRNVGDQNAPVEPRARAILALGGDVAPALFGLLSTGRLPSLDPGQTEATVLSALQEAIVLEALRRLGRERLSAFVEEVLADPADAGRIAAALRVAGLNGRAAGVDDMARLLRTSLRLGPSSSAIEEAFEAALAELLTRDRKTFDALGFVWEGLAAEHASAALRALQANATQRALQCLQRLLGRRPELETSVLLALAGPAPWADRETAEDLAGDVQGYLSSRDPLQVQAASTTLGKLRVPASVPALVELLSSDESPVARSALAALRAISGMGFPAAPQVWRRWYDSEEAWWQDEAPVLFQELSNPATESLTEARIVELLRQLSEHPLHRDELAMGMRGWLQHPSPGVRGLTCQALRRLDSRRALPFLCARLDDEEPSVASAAHEALLAITQAELPREREACTAYLRANGVCSEEE